MVRLFIAFTVAVMAIAAVCMAQQPATKPATHYNLITTAALDAFRRYDLAEAAARRIYDSTVADAVGKLVVELRQQQERMTKTGNLDEALRLRNAIADLGQRKAPQSKQEPPEAVDGGNLLLRVLPGTAWKNYDGWTMTLHKDMSATSTHHRAAGTWAVLDAKTIRLSISMHNCDGYPVTVSADGTKLVDPEGKVLFTFVAKP